MLKEGLEMDSGNDKIQEELREVQKEVEDAEEKTSSTTSTARRLEEAEEGNSASPIHSLVASAGGSTGKLSLTNRRSKERADKAGFKSLKDGVVNLANLFLNPILVQTFIMTFLAEWGDRSQISTIALAAAHVSRFFARMEHSLPDKHKCQNSSHCPSERLHRHHRHRPRPPDVHRSSRPRRAVPGHKDLCKTRHARRGSPLPHLWNRIRL